MMLLEKSVLILCLRSRGIWTSQTSIQYRYTCRTFYVNILGSISFESDHHQLLHQAS